MRIVHFLTALGFAIGLVPAASSARPMDQKAWEKCRDSALGVAEQQRLGPAAIDQLIKKHCGDVPVSEPKASGALAGAAPFDVVRSAAWKAKFQSLLGARYAKFARQIEAATGPTQVRDSWAVGSGNAPHLGGVDEAAFAIDLQNGKVYAAMKEDGKHLTGYGFGKSLSAAPPFLQDWMKGKR